MNGAIFKLIANPEKVSPQVLEQLSRSLGMVDMRLLKRMRGKVDLYEERAKEISKILGMTYPPFSDVALKTKVSLPQRWNRCAYVFTAAACVLTQMYVPQKINDEQLEEAKSYDAKHEHSSEKLRYSEKEKSPNINAVKAVELVLVCLNKGVTRSLHQTIHFEDQESKRQDMLDSLRYQYTPSKSVNLLGKLWNSANESQLTYMSKLEKYEGDIEWGLESISMQTGLSPKQLRFVHRKIKEGREKGEDKGMVVMRLYKKMAGSTSEQPKPRREVGQRGIKVQRVQSAKKEKQRKAAKEAMKDLKRSKRSQPKTIKEKLFYAADELEDLPIEPTKPYLFEPQNEKVLQGFIDSLGRLENAIKESEPQPSSVTSKGV